MPEVTRVLVVDDDLGDCHLIEALLEGARRRSYRVEHVGSYAEAVEALQQANHDIYLVDYFLGTATGEQLLEKARQIKCEKPLVILTSQGRDDIDEKVISLGASDFIPKGELSTSLLERTIRHAIKHKKHELAMERMIKKDPLTKLDNRLSFEENLQRSLLRARRGGRKLAIMFLDLDRFKEINDTLGHHVGDELLIEVAQRILTTVRRTDLTARIGGDEFIILLEEISDYSDAHAVAEQLLAALARPFELSDVVLNITACIGISLFPDNDDNSVTLMQKADMALYEAKRFGAGNAQFYSNNLQTRLEQSIRIEQGLRRALKNGQFQLQLQPKQCLNKGRILGFEGLLRWPDEEHGHLRPEVFIPIAEKTGLITTMGDWVVEQACQLLRRWQDADYDFSLSINISPVQLLSPQFIDSFEAMVRNAGIDPTRLELELTEETLIDVSGANNRIMRSLYRIKALGSTISIDDFGTGYSSLRYLKQFPVDNLKIDKSFISGSHANIAEPEITQAIITLAASLGLKVIAEGIETQEQFQALKALACDQGQGFLLSPPVPAAEALALALSHNAALG